MYSIVRNPHLGNFLMVLGVVIFLGFADTAYLCALFALYYERSSLRRKCFSDVVGKSTELSRQDTGVSQTRLWKTPAVPFS
jgi:hypothetical protein